MADLFLERGNTNEVAQTADFLVKVLALEDGMRIYDQCCGIGTLANALAKRGMKPVGADLCSIYIDRAKVAAADQGVCSEFYCEDAFEFVPQPVNATFNWYSSFGYSVSDEQNCDMLRRAFESLLPGGRFAMDVPNFPNLMRDFQFNLVRSGISAGREVTCVRESRIDWHAGQLKQVWRWFSGGGPTIERESALRIYWPHQIYEMLNLVGFENVQMFGDTDQSKLDMKSPRLILIAQKPK